MLSNKPESISFVSATTHITHPTAYTHNPATSVGEQSLKLARFAYVRSLGDSPSAIEYDKSQSAVVIRTVASAIERAFRDEMFSRLSFEQQEVAAARLTSQCLAGLRVVHALQGAMLNPFTMATQLKNNAFQPGDRYNVFDHIISAHRPDTTISAIASHEIDSLPAGRA